MTLVHEIRKALNKKQFNLLGFCPGFSSDKKTEQCNAVLYTGKFNKQSWMKFNLSEEEKRNITSYLCTTHHKKYIEHAIKKYNIH